MRKQLLLFLTLLTFGIASAQIPINQPFDIVLCTNEGTAVQFADETGAVLGNLSQNDYAVTYHFSESDAQAGINQLSDPYFTSMSQVIYVRVTEIANPSNFEVTSFSIVLNPSPFVQNFGYDVCDNNSDGFSYVDLGSIAEMIWGMTQSSTFNINFYETYADAVNNVNPLSWSNYFNTQPFQQVIYANTSDPATGCSNVSEVELYITQCGTICPPPMQLVAMNITMTTAMLGWTETGNATSWEVFLTPAGSASPGVSTTGMMVNLDPFVVTGLSCGTAYDFYIRAVCDATTMSQWTMQSTFATVNCFGSEPNNLAECAENGLACFDLTVNDEIILNGADPGNYTISYYHTIEDANTGTNAIADPTSLCVPVSMLSPTIYVRIFDNNSNQYQIASFSITAQEFAAGTIALSPLAQCDDDNNGVVTFNLTSVATQLNTSNPLVYYTSSDDAMSQINPITTESAYTVSAGTFTVIFVREVVDGDCDIIHSVQLSASGNCNIATVCAAANSLCNALGMAFNNSQNTNAETGNDYGCLGSQPNPTWFFIPVSTPGTINLTIEQNSSINFDGFGQDVDYICYGPFANPITPCSGMLNSAAIVSCSFSTAAVENPIIPNAQIGQFYLLMVTNFSNQPGYIRINQSGGQGEIDCSGLRLNAFLDTNSNGTKDSGEPNFPLGQFNYERNDDSNVHNITSPNGIYNIYDLNPANSYDLGFTVDAAYSANYSLTTPTYSNVSAIAGGGMQEYFFPVTVTQIYSDLAVSIIPNEEPRPGFSYSNKILYSNLGSQTMASGTVTFVKDPLVTITGITQSGTVPNATGFTYGFTNLLPFETREITVTMQVPNMPTVALGNLLTNTAEIAPLAGDIAPENNSSVMAQVIIGSYDPNDKMESRGGQIVFSDFGSDDYLYYTVRFENTGTASAVNVMISDILDSGLDETTVRMVSASHDCVLDRLDNILTWRFDNIQLPTTVVDPQGGKGYVHFKVKPRAGYAVGDVIPNTASIFFDFNPAIVTNTFTSTFVTSLATPDFENVSFVMYPNPAGDQVTISGNSDSGSISAITIYDMLGKTILSQKGSGSLSESIDVSGISSGMYFLEVTTSANLKEVQKLIIK